LTPDPSPEATGYASWDETLTLKETIEALEATLDDLNQQDTHIAYRLSSIIDEFRRGDRPAQRTVRPDRGCPRSVRAPAPPRDETDEITC